MDSAVVATNAAGFASGDVISMWGRAIPRWARKRYWQDGDLAIFEWVYRVLGWEWIKSRPSTFTITRIEDGNTIYISPA